MSALKWIKILFLASFLFMGGCSSDSGDGKDDKGDKSSNQVSPASGVVSEKSSCLKNDDLRLQCYQAILKIDSRVADELNGANPFLNQTWDKLDLHLSSYAPQILSCREKYPQHCQ